VGAAIVFGENYALSEPVSEMAGKLENFSLQKGLLASGSQFRAAKVDLSSCRDGNALSSRKHGKSEDFY
jgi:hypothetical protein